MIIAVNNPVKTAIEERRLIADMCVPSLFENVDQGIRTAIHLDAGYLNGAVEIPLEEKVLKRLNEISFPYCEFTFVEKVASKDELIWEAHIVTHGVPPTDTSIIRLFQRAVREKLRNRLQHNAYFCWVMVYEVDKLFFSISANTNVVKETELDNAYRYILNSSTTTGILDTLITKCGPLIINDYEVPIA